MIGPAIFYQAVSTADLAVDQNEIAARLQTARGYTSETIEQCKKQLLQYIACKFSGVRVPVVYGQETDTVDFGCGMVHSHSLTNNLNGAEEAFIFAVTLGHQVDRLLARLKVTSPAECFITDALASAYAEAAADYAENFMKQNQPCRPRFSPGYGDLNLSTQPEILALTNAEKRLGITLDSGMLMSPVKSITAIMGIEHE